MAENDVGIPATPGELVTIHRPKSVLLDMADRYGMEPLPFEATVRAICMPPTATREEFAAFLLVAKEYRLNPLTKEIYAFPKRGGGIVPIVSVDGWLSLINSHPACDGFTFTWVQDDKGDPISCTCIMYRKDRSHPVEVTEYLSECIRPTDPWKMKHRMLRHKALIQCGRYAFGFSGIYDEDEGEKIAEARDIAPMRLAPPTPPEPPTGGGSDPTAKDTSEPSELPVGQDDAPSEAFNLTHFLERIEEDMLNAGDEATVQEVWEHHDVEKTLGQDVDLAEKVRDRALDRIRRAAAVAAGQDEMFPGDR